MENAENAEDLYKTRNYIINALEGIEEKETEDTEDTEDDKIDLNWTYGSKDELEKLKKWLVRLRHLILQLMVDMWQEFIHQS